MLLAYQALRERRLSYDAMMWQSPALGVAAQSFLLATAFDFSKGFTACVVCSLLSIALGFCSMQLMLKHRHHELITTVQLRQLERDYGLYPVHERPTQAVEDDHLWWMTNISSFRLWMVALLLPTLAGVLAAVSALLKLS